MRIALINMKKKKGGLEKFSSRLSSALQNRGCTVSSLNEDSFLLPRTRLRKKHAFNKACYRFVKKHSFHAVVGLEKTSFQTHLRLGEGLHASYLEQRKLYEPFWKSFQLRFSRFHKSLLDLEKKALTSPDLRVLFCNSSMVKEAVLDRYPVDEKKIQVVHNGVEWKEMEKDFFSWQSRKKETLTEWSLPNTFHFLFVGSGFARKGLLPLLKGFSLLKEDAHLSIVGQDKEINYYKRYAKKLGVEKKVTFFGWAKTSLFYQYADCTVIPSFYDPFANVTIESLAMGVPVISSKYNGGKELLEPDQIIEDLLDPSSIANALSLAMKSPKSFEQSLSLRNSVKSYDFSQKLTDIVHAILQS